MQDFQQTYRSAIALNNMGIELLERDCHQQSLATLRDSMQVMRSVFHQHQEKGFPTREESSCDGIRHLDVQRYTQDAAFRFANPRTTGRKTNMCIQSLAVSDCQPSPSSWGRSQLPPASNLGYLPSPSSTLYPIRIDANLSGENASFEESFEDDIELNVAVILFNYAMATWSCSFLAHQGHSKGHPQDRSSICHMVARLLELPHQILEKLSLECEDEFQLRRIVAINAIVVRCLLQVFVDLEEHERRLLHQEEEGQQRRLREEGRHPRMQLHVALLKEKLEELNCTIEQIDELFSHWKTSTNSAPAA